MRTKETTLTGTSTSPSTASTAIGATITGGYLASADKVVVDATLTAPASGTLDVYLQRKVADNTWRDWIHFPQLAAGQSKKFTVAITGEGTTIAGTSAIVETGGGSDASPGVALAAGVAVNVTPGGPVRMVFVAGTGTAAGASNTVTITPYTEAH